MPDELFETGVVARVIDLASKPATVIGVAIGALITRFADLRKRGAGVVKEVVSTPLGLATGVVDKFKSRLLLLGTALAGFFAFRKLKSEITGIFEEAVKLEEQLVRIANQTGSQRFANDILNWVRTFSKELRISREELFAVADSLREIGINAAEIDPRGFIAAAQTGVDIGTLLNAIKESAFDPSALTRIQELLPQLPFVQLQEIFATPITDVQQRVEQINQVLFRTFGDNIERTRNSIVGLRQGLGLLFLEFRESIAGVGTPLFEFFRETIQRTLAFFERNARLMQDIGRSISQILTATLMAFRDFAGSVFEAFGINLKEITASGDAFRKRFLLPATVEIIGLIARIEVFAEKAVETISNVFGFLGSEEGVFLTRAAGVGAMVLGVLFRNPVAFFAGAALLGFTDIATAANAGGAEPLGIGSIIAGINDALDSNAARLAFWAGFNILPFNPPLGAVLMAAGVGLGLGGRIGAAIDEEKGRAETVRGQAEVAAATVSPGGGAQARLMAERGIFESRLGLLQATFAGGPGGGALAGLISSIAGIFRPEEGALAGAAVAPIRPELAGRAAERLAAAGINLNIIISAADLPTQMALSAADKEVKVTTGAAEEER